MLIKVKNTQQCIKWGNHSGGDQRLRLEYKDSKEFEDVLCFGTSRIVFRSQSSPKAQTNTWALSGTSQIQTAFVAAAQQARLACWWKDQACRWMDRVSRGAWFRENWAGLRLTLIVGGSQSPLDFHCCFSGLSHCVRVSILMPQTKRQAQFI